MLSTAAATGYRGGTAGGTNTHENSSHRPGTAVDPSEEEGGTSDRGDPTPLRLAIYIYPTNPKSDPPWSSHKYLPYKP